MTREPASAYVGSGAAVFRPNQLRPLGGLASGWAFNHRSKRARQSRPRMALS